MKRWLLALVSVTVSVLCLGTPALAATSTAALGMELVVIVPSGKDLAILQQVVFQPTGSEPQVGLLQGAQQVQVSAGATALQVNSGSVTFKGSPSGATIKYRIPWNQRSASLVLPFYSTDKALVILIPKQLTLPTVLNPSLQLVGNGKLAPNYPDFQEYATSNLASGEAFDLAVESSATVASSTPLVGPGGVNGSYPLVGGIMEALIALTCFGAVYLGLNWSPLTLKFRWRQRREALLQEIAELDASRKRGEVDEAFYQRQRTELLNEIAKVWGESPRAV